MTRKNIIFAALAALLAGSIAAVAGNYTVDGNLILLGQVQSNPAHVNNVGITSAATGVVPQIAIGGSNADTNVGIALNGNGTGSVYLGGTTAANAAASVAHGSSNVNQVIITGTNAGSVPSIAIGGSGADANRNLNVAGAGTGIVTLGQAICTVAGASPQTCNGQRGIVTTGTLTTAANTNTTYTISDSSVGASSLVLCTSQGYSGTYGTNGSPIIQDCAPGSGIITVHLTNANSYNALSGTVQFGFSVMN